jgi:hypothetical protein
MERIPETIDVAVVAERIRPLAHQASESLRHTSESLRQTSESLRQSLDHAREVITERIESDAPVVLVERPAAIALAARGLPIAGRMRDLGRSPLQWLALAIATALVATLAAFAIAAIARQLQARGRSGATEAPAIPRVEPVAIPISEATTDAEAGADAAVERTEARIAEAG